MALFAAVGYTGRIKANGGQIHDPGRKITTAAQIARFIAGAARRGAGRFSRQAISKWECGDSTPDLDKLRAICTYFGVTTDYLIWERSEDAPQAAEQKQGGDTRGRSGIFNDALLLVMTIVVMAAVWSVARTGFESYTALHFVLGAMAIAAAVLACTVWKKRGRPICFGIAAAGTALAIARLASMLGYLVDLWSTSREYADGGDWPIVWESAGNWLQSDLSYYLFYLALIVGGLLLAHRLKKRGEA